jgi:hypothetical protein
LSMMACPDCDRLGLVHNRTIVGGWTTCTRCRGEGSISKINTEELLIRLENLEAVVSNIIANLERMSCNSNK